MPFQLRSGTLSHDAVTATQPLGIPMPCLPFSDCDVVANFYEFVFINSGNPIVRRLIIARLIDMGASHNRWGVGSVLAGMLAGIENAGTDQLAAEAIRADPYHARWFLPYVETLELPRQVAAAFDQLKEASEPETADIPF